MAVLTHFMCSLVGQSAPGIAEPPVDAGGGDSRA